MPRYENIESLYQFRLYRDRADYEARTGQQPPAFDPGAPIKRWMGGNPFGPSVTFSTYDAQGKPQTYTLTAADFSGVNFPGRRRYDPLKHAATTAVIAGEPVDPSLLIEHSEAAQLARELADAAQRSGLVAALELIESAAGTFPGLETDWGKETRRHWMIRLEWTYEGQPYSQEHSAAVLRNIRHASGRDSPGRWTFDGEAGPQWQDAQIPSEPAPHHPEILAPCRELKAGESVVKPSPFGPPMVQVETGETLPAGAFTSADRQTLQANYAMLQAILETLRANEEYHAQEAHS